MSNQKSQKQNPARPFLTVKITKIFLKFKSINLAMDFLYDIKMER